MKSNEYWITSLKCQRLNDTSFCGGGEIINKRDIFGKSNIVCKSEIFNILQIAVYQRTDKGA